MTDLFTPVSSGRISARIVDQIQSAIRTGQLKPGDRLPAERELAARFGVSRVTVRDALRSLEVLDLVEIKVGASGGAFVRSPGTQVVGEGLTNLMLLSSLEPEAVAETRLVIELGTVALAVARADDGDVAELRKLVTEGEQALEEDAYDTQMSTDFHMRLATSARNDAISLLAESFRGVLSMRPLRQQEPERQSHARTVTEHREITEAVAKGDADRAQRAMAAHLLRGGTLTEESARALLSKRTDFGDVIESLRQ